MNLIEEVRYRSIKVLGNACKVAFSIHLRLFPKARWDLPINSPARKIAVAPKRIPRIVWQTNYSNRVSLPIFVNFKFNRFIAPTYEHRYCDDYACDALVRENYPGAIWDAYSKLQVGAAKADFWRLLVLHKHGGIYLDIDSNFAAPPEKFINPDASEILIAMKDGEITNYFMASEPGNPLLMRIVDKVVTNINENKLDSVYDLTGPTVVHAVATEQGIKPVLYKSVCTQGQFTNKKSQYVDKPNGAWWTEQSEKSIVRS